MTSSSELNLKICWTGPKILTKKIIWWHLCHWLKTVLSVIWNFSNTIVWIKDKSLFLLPIYPTTHLFFSNPHVVLDPREHRGLDEESVTPRGLPSTLHPGALFLARVNQLQNLAVLLLVHLLKVRNYGYTCTAIRQLNRFLHWIVVSRIQDNLLLLFVSFFYVLKTSSWYRWCAKR